jgi:hypothetical protein
MARVLQAYLLLCSRDPLRVRSAVPVLARAAGLPATRRERLHIAAIAAVLADDYEGAKAILGEVLRHEPVDVLALQVAHAFDYLTGDPLGMKARVDAVLPAWSEERPGRHAVLAMHAFALEECGDLAGAEQAARAALALEPADARAHHVMAHRLRDDTASRRPVCAGWAITATPGREAPSSDAHSGGTLRFSIWRRTISTGHSRCTTGASRRRARATSPS